MENECIDSFDCVNGSIVKQCYEQNDFSDEIFFCDCSNWFGWIGENCDEPGPTVYYTRIVLFFFVAWNLFNLITLSKTCYLLGNFTYKKSFLKEVNPIFYVVVLDIFASLGLLSSRIVDAPSHFDSSQYVVAEINFGSSNLIGVERKNITILSNSLIVFGSVCHLFGSMIIILSWMEVFNKMNKIIKLDGIIYEKIIQRTIIIIISITALTFITLSALEVLGVVILLYSIMALFLIISYVVGYCRFRKRMISLLQGSLGGKEKAALRLVKRSCQVKVFSFIGLIVCNLIFFYGFSNHTELLKIGGFNYYFIFYDGILSFGLISITHTSYYSHSMNERLLRNAGSAENTSWLPFYSFCKKKKKATTDVPVSTAINS